MSSEARGIGSHMVNLTWSTSLSKRERLFRLFI